MNDYRQIDEASVLAREREMDRMCVNAGQKTARQTSEIERELSKLAEVEKRLQDQFNELAARLGSILRHPEPIPANPAIGIGPPQSNPEQQIRSDLGENIANIRRRFDTISSQVGAITNGLCI